MGAGATRDGKPNQIFKYRVACQKCINSYQRDWAGGPCHWRPRDINLSSSGTSCFNGYDENNKIDTHPKDTKTCKNAECKKCKNALYIDPETGITIFEESGTSTRQMDQVDDRAIPSRFAHWKNEFLLNWEVGMSLKFDVDPETFRAKNCPGLEVTNDGKGPFEDAICAINAVCTSKVPDCPPQDYIDPTSGKPIRQILEEFADDHDVWAEAFLAGWQRMQETGYDVLNDAPQNSWMGYNTLKEMGAVIGDDYEDFIDQHAPVVFTKEDTTKCHWKIQNGNCKEGTFREIYEEKGAPIPDLIFGPSCDNFEDCNNPAF